MTQLPAQYRANTGHPDDDRPTGPPPDTEPRQPWVLVDGKDAREWAQIAEQRYGQIQGQARQLGELHMEARRMNRDRGIMRAEIIKLGGMLEAYAASNRIRGERIARLQDRLRTAEAMVEGFVEAVQQRPHGSFSLRQLLQSLVAQHLRNKGETVQRIGPATSTPSDYVPVEVP